MDSFETLRMYQWAGAIAGLLFMFALGGIVGSFINVLVYRLPRGQNVVLPASRCPACGTKLRWRDNIPILGWVLLRGKCRYCRSPISAEYPVVELVMALLFALLHAMWFMQPSVFEAMNVNMRLLEPDWARERLVHVWPMFALILLLISSLIAMTLVDARTFTIPLALPWITAGVALIVHPAHALWLSLSRGGLRPLSAHRWTIPTLDWHWTGLALGAGLGLAIACALLAAGLIRRSFADYEAWEAEATKRSADSSQPGAPEPPGEGLGPVMFRVLLLTGPAIAAMLLGFSLGLRVKRPMEGMFLGMAIGLLAGVLLRRLAPGGAAHGGDPIWIQYPHARREMGRELIFLSPVALLAAAGWLAATRLAPADAEPPLWLAAFSASLLGLLVGGGVIWAARILGTLALGKEAMGLGDVHLLAAVGAVLGWIDPLLAFFVAPFFGIAWTLLSVVMSRFFRRAGTALPYGPHLAAATLLIIYARPLFELALSAILRRPVDLP